MIYAKGLDEAKGSSDIVEPFPLTRMYTSIRTSTSTQTSTRYSKDGEDVQIVNSSAVRHTINY